MKTLIRSPDHENQIHLHQEDESHHEWTARCEEPDNDIRVRRPILLVWYL